MREASHRFEELVEDSSAAGRPAVRVHDSLPATPSDSCTPSPIPPPAATTSQLSGTTSKIAIAGYIAATFVAFLDSNLLAPNLTAAAATFGFSDAERDWKLGGELAFGYFVVAAPVALIVGRLADSFSRRWLFAWVLLLGKLPCLLTFFVTAYWQLFVLRTFMGITVGSVLPIMSSLAGDMFPVESRTTATAAWNGSTVVGALMGQYVGGLLGPVYGWRFPFLIIAIPGMVASGLVLLLPEPVRGRQEEALRERFEAAQSGETEEFKYKPRITCAKVVGIFKVPCNVLSFVQGLPGCVPWGVIYVYFNDFLAQEKGMAIQDAAVVMVVFGICSGVGMISGGMIGQRVYNVWKPGMPLLMGISTFLGVIPTLFAINYPFDPKHPFWICVASGSAGFLVSITGGNIRTVILNVNPPEIRGTVFGVFCITDDVGKGFGPFISAALVAWFGRVTAFNVCVCLWIPCSVMLSAMALFQEVDERRMQAHLATFVEMQTVEEAEKGGGPRAPRDGTLRAMKPDPDAS